VKLPAGVVKTFKDIQLNFESIASELDSAITVSQPSRAFGTDYRPSSKKPTMVMAQFNCGTAVVTGVEALIGAASPASMHLAFEQSTTGGTNEYRSLTFMVPGGWWYRLVAANGLPGGLVVSEWTL
jgi:hypothetical protein